MTYHSPSSVAEAVALLAPGPVDVLAGGTDWYPAKPAGPVHGDIVDLTRVAGLRGIARTDAGWRFGATTTWTDIARADLPPAFRGLQQAARMVGGVQVQNAGTIGGNLCNASPAADGVPPLLTLDARVELTGSEGIRELPLQDFLTGPRRTARTAGELLTAVLVPRPDPRAAGAFAKLGARRYLVISVVMAAAVVECDDRGVIHAARVAVGACGPVASRLKDLESALLGLRPGDVRVKPEHLGALSPIDDIRADAPSRLEMAAEQTRRAICAAAGNAHG